MLFHPMTNCKFAKLIFSKKSIQDLNGQLMMTVKLLTKKFILHGPAQLNGDLPFNERALILHLLRYGMQNNYLL